jgi:hypothetical protein
VTMVILSSLAPGPTGSIGAAIFCYANSTAGTFTIPVALLSALPPSYTDADGNPQGTVEVFERIVGQPFTASGLDLTTTSSQVTYTRSFVLIQ